MRGLLKNSDIEKLAALSAYASNRGLEDISFLCDKLARTLEYIEHLEQEAAKNDFEHHNKYLHKRIEELDAKCKLLTDGVQDIINFGHDYRKDDEGLKNPQCEPWCPKCYGLKLLAAVKTIDGSWECVDK